MEPDSNAYLQSLLAALQKDEKAKAELEAKLLEGVRSPHVVADEKFWQERKRKLIEKHRESADEPDDE
jgi:hypothetical protein